MKKSQRFSKFFEAKQPRIPGITWEIPSKFVLASDLRIRAGEESEEKAVQEVRESRVFESLYGLSSYFPRNPFCATGIDEECYDDTQTPLIPMIPIEETQAAAAATTPSDVSSTVSLQHPVMTPLNAQGGASLPVPVPVPVPAIDVVDTTPSYVSNIVSLQHPAVTPLNAQGGASLPVPVPVPVPVPSIDVVATTPTNVSSTVSLQHPAVTPLNAQGGASLPVSVSVPVPVPAKDVAATTPYDVSSTVSLQHPAVTPLNAQGGASLPVPVPVPVPVPAIDVVAVMDDRGLPKKLESDDEHPPVVTEYLLAPVPAIGNSNNSKIGLPEKLESHDEHPPIVTESLLAPVPATGDSNNAKVALPMLKEADYYKSLKKNYGEEGEISEEEGEILGEKQSPKRNEFSNKRFQKYCIFFNTHKGCRNGWKCHFRHEAYNKKMPNGKRMKINW